MQGCNTLKDIIKIFQNYFENPFSFKNSVIEYARNTTRNFHNVAEQQQRMGYVANTGTVAGIVGMATLFGGSGKKVNNISEKPTKTQSKLQKLTVKSLREIATKINLKYSVYKKKDDLIQALLTKKKRGWTQLLDTYKPAK